VVQNLVAMGGSLASVGLLADTGTSIRRFVDVFVGVYILLIFAYIITSWVRLPYSPTLSRIQRFLYDVCDPYLRIFRRVLPPLGPLDLSPIVAIFALIILQQLVGALIEGIL
jgi:uncharacterized protein YggT (Ycf19 family)